MRVGSSGPARSRRRAVGPRVPDQSKQWQADGQASSSSKIESLLRVDGRIQFGPTPSRASSALLALNRKLDILGVEVTMGGADDARAMNAPKYNAPKYKMERSIRVRGMERPGVPERSHFVALASGR